MSKLPSGYTELKYIESTGTQYIDTGFKPNHNTRVLAKVKLLNNKASAWAFGARRTNTTKMFTFTASKAGYYTTDYGDTKEAYDSTLAFTSAFVIDKNKNVTTLNGENIKTNKEATFNCPVNLVLFGVNTNGTVMAGAAAANYYKIYDNELLVRDFIPCRDPSGAVGLYDLVNGQFYANAGSGAFTAGPEVIREPDTPADFTASVSGQTVALSWAASANAAGYRLKRDGVQIADQPGTTYTDTVPDGTALCTYALTAYNDDGESAAATLTVILRLDLITDRTRADVANQTDKGFYNASDLNRVGAAVEYIAGRFTSLGYACPVTVKTDWLTTDAPTASQMEAYRQNIVTLRGQIAVMASTPEVPASMAGLDYVKANNIEQILADMDSILQNMPAASRHCGVTVCGSKGVIA